MYRCTVSFAFFSFLILRWEGHNLWASGRYLVSGFASDREEEIILMITSSVEAEIVNFLCVAM